MELWTSIPINSTVVSFDIDYSDHYVLYLTDHYQLYQTFFKFEDNESTQVATIDYKSIKPTQIAVDYVHDLVYLVANELDIFAAELNHDPTQTVLLFSFHSVKIMKLLVCPRLSLLVWSEIEWHGTNLNKIRVGLQDGTQHITVYQSKLLIYDIELDQTSLELYFLTDKLGQLSLSSLSHYRTLSQSGDPIVTYTSIAIDMKRLMVLREWYCLIASLCVTHLIMLS